MTHSPQPQLGAALEGELRAAVAAIRELFQAAACSCALVVDDGASLGFVAADGAGARAIVGQSIPVGRGIAGWVAMSGQPITVGDVASDSRFARDVAESTEYVPTKIMAAPLVSSDGEVRGVIEVLDPAELTAGDWWLSVLGTLASQVAALVALMQTEDLAGTEALRASVAALAAAGPGATRLAEQVVALVAGYVSEHP